MLRITIHDGTKNERTKLEGKLAEPCVEEVSRVWQSLLASPSGKELHLDLRGVGFVDAKGRELLREIYRQTNASFLADSPLTRHYAGEAMERSPKIGEEGV